MVVTSDLLQWSALKGLESNPINFFVTILGSNPIKAICIYLKSNKA